MKRPHFALPEIYDDSLSYYDVLRKLIKSMHVISDNLNKIPEQIANEAKARLLGDQNLQQNINSETTTREQADQEIRENVSDKISELKSDLSNVKNLNTIVSNLDFYQTTWENRIWYSAMPDVWNVGDTVETDAEHFVSFYYVNESGGRINSPWHTKATCEEPYTDGICIRDKTASDISSMTKAQILSVIEVNKFNELITSVKENKNDIEELKPKVERLISSKSASKYIHISIDDSKFWKDLIDRKDTLTSAFENTYLKIYKSLHDSYGVCFTLNCFCSDGDYDISNVPTKFANEFKENSDWLKFSFHAENSASMYDTDKTDEIKASYDKFVNAIYGMTGTTECIDKVVRLGFYTGTLNNIKAIRDTTCGIVGLLYKDEDTGWGYYFDESLWKYVNIHGKVYDSNNYLTILKTNVRFESHINDFDDIISSFESINYGCKKNYLELFTHEYAIDNNFKTNVGKVATWGYENGYAFAFAQDFLKL